MPRIALCLILLALSTPALAIEGIETGKVPPAFTLESISGTEVSLEDFLGHTTALLFWSTWSPRSAEMLADFRDYQLQYGRDGFRVVAVNADHENLSRAERDAIGYYVDAMDISFPVLLDRGLKTYAAYGIEALPSAVILDAEGRVFYSLGGYPLFTYREELRDSFLTAMGHPPPSHDAPRVALSVPPKVNAETPGEEKRACALPRSRFCMMAAEREGGDADPAIMAVRLALCRGDVAEAEKMLRGIGSEQLEKNELRFALAHLMLLKGRNDSAESLFTDLGRGDGESHLGSWGLGLVALAEGRTADALRHMNEAARNGSVNTEAETATLSYLLEFWSEGKAAPREESFLSLFAALSPIKRCFSELDKKT